MKDRYIRANNKWAKVSGSPGRYAVAIGWKGDVMAIAGWTQITATQQHAIIIAKDWANDLG